MQAVLPVVIFIIQITVAVPGQPKIAQSRKKKPDSQAEDRLVVATSTEVGGQDWESGVNRCPLLHMERINRKVLLDSTGHSTPYPVIKP